jgi:hypothetical protein
MEIKDKIFEFYFNWVVKQFNLPDGLTIFLEEKCEQSDLLGFYQFKTNKVVLYTSHIKTGYDGLLTLAHELRHAEQYKEKKLINWFDRGKRWTPLFSNVYSYETIEKNYHNLPWEIDARETEDRVFKKWLDYHYSFNIIRAIRWKFFKPKQHNTYTFLNNNLESYLRPELVKH